MRYTAFAAILALACSQSLVAAAELNRHPGQLDFRSPPPSNQSDLQEIAKPRATRLPAVGQSVSVTARLGTPMASETESSSRRFDLELAFALQEPNSAGQSTEAKAAGCLVGSKSSSCGCDGACDSACAGYHCGSACGSGCGEVIRPRCEDMSCNQNQRDSKVCVPRTPVHLPASSFHQYFRSNRCYTNVWDGYTKECTDLSDSAGRGVPRPNQGCGEILNGNCGCRSGCASGTCD